MGDDAARSVNHGDDSPACHPGSPAHSVPIVKSTSAIVIAASIGSAVSSLAAISIQNFTPATNDRFANDPAFTAGAYDWSGVGRSADGKWVTMLTPNVFIGADHFHPGIPGSGIGTTVSFFPGNDPAASAISGTIAGAQQLGGTDLWIGYLASPLPGSIATYGFATIPLTGATFGTSTAANQFAYLSGISPTVGGYGAFPPTNQATGTNRIEGFQQALTLEGRTGDVLLLVQNLPGDAGFFHTSYETDLNDGDSGSPLMTVSGGNLVVSGIAWASGTTDIDPGPGTTIRNLAVYTYTGNYADDIQAYITAHPVPEPSALALLAGSCLFIGRRRR